MNKNTRTPRVLFLSDGNAERAQMAAGLLAALAGTNFEIYSAGIDGPAPPSRMAIVAMREFNIAISTEPAADLKDYEDIQFDHVITLCDQADNNCLGFPRDGHVMHWQLADPANIESSEEQVLSAYRQARDALAVRVEAWYGSITTTGRA